MEVERVWQVTSASGKRQVEKIKQIINKKRYSIYFENKIIANNA